MGCGASSSAPAGERIEKLKPDGAVIFVLGGPGTGKGTQCAKIVEKYGAAHFSAGDLLRAEVASGSPQGDMIATMIKAGEIVPAQVTIDLLKAAIKSRKGPYLIDGFPRSLDNLEAFDKQVVGSCALTLFYDLSTEVMEQRLIERGKTSGRADDNIETIKKRFNTFQTQSVPVVRAAGHAPSTAPNPTQARPSPAHPRAHERCRWISSRRGSSSARSTPRNPSTTSSPPRA